MGLPGVLLHSCLGYGPKIALDWTLHQLISKWQAAAHAESWPRAKERVGVLRMSLAREAAWRRAFEGVQPPGWLLGNWHPGRQSAFSNGPTPRSCGGRCVPKIHKKRPLGYACLDEFQICQTKGARSRNHKKMGCSARCFKRIDPSIASALGTSSGPDPNIRATPGFL